MTNTEVSLHEQYDRARSAVDYQATRVAIHLDVVRRLEPNLWREILAVMGPRLDAEMDTWAAADAKRARIAEAMRADIEERGEA